MRCFKCASVICALFVASQAFSMGKKEHLFPEGQVFPLIMLAVGESDFAQVREGEFNAVHRYQRELNQKELSKYYASARKYNLQVVQQLPAEQLPNSEAWWQEKITWLASHDNLAWWYLPEEKRALEVKKLADLIHSIDPLKRPTATYLAWQKEPLLSEFKGVLDILIKSSYPAFYAEPHATVLAWLTNISDVRDSIPISIGCSELFHLKGNSPTAKGLRFDEYASLVMGVKGMAWYSWARGKDVDPSLEKEARQFAWEMNGPDNHTRLGPVVIEGEEINRITGKVLSGPQESPSTKFFDVKKNTTVLRTWPSLLWKEKRFGPQTYVFSVNSAEVYPPRASYTSAEILAEFTIPNPTKSVEVLFEGRKIPVKEGKFVDKFDPLGVHIYRY